MLDDRLYLRIMNVFTVFQTLTIIITFYFFLRRGESVMSKTLNRILFIHLILCSFSGLWMVMVSRPLPILPCLAFYSAGPLTYNFNISSIEVISFLLVSIAAESAVVVCLLLWQCLAVLVQISSRRKYYLRLIFFVHTFMLIFVTAAIFPMFKFFPYPVQPCLKAAGITRPDKAQLGAFVVDVKDVRTQIVLFTYVEGLLYFGGCSIGSCIMLIRKLNEKREVVSQANTSNQKAITVTVLGLASVQTVFALVPVAIFLIEYLCELYDEIAIKMSILLFAFGQIVEPLALLFTLKTFRRTLSKWFRLRKKVSATRSVNTATIISMIKVR
ncbi:unnamed protein product [Auanema sp. JU1783]|nr:unnamed protein product [Auanema sp. JU1783]